MLVELDVGGLDRQRAASRHGIPRVHREVHDDLLHLPAIGHHRRELGPEGQHDLHVFPDQAAEHRPHVGHHHVQVEQRRQKQVEFLHASLALEGGANLGADDERTGQFVTLTDFGSHLQGWSRSACTC